MFDPYWCRWFFFCYFSERFISQAQNNSALCLLQDLLHFFNLSLVELEWSSSLICRTSIKPWWTRLARILILHNAKSFLPVNFSISKRMVLIIASHARCHLFGITWYSHQLKSSTTHKHRKKWTHGRKHNLHGSAKDPAYIHGRKQQLYWPIQKRVLQLQNLYTKKN